MAREEKRGDREREEEEKDRRAHEGCRGECSNGEVKGRKRGSSLEKEEVEEVEEEEEEKEEAEEAEEEEEEAVLHRASALSRSHVRPYNTRNTCNTDNTCNTCVTHYTPA